MHTFQPYLIGILLSSKHLVSERQVRGNKLSSLLFLLLDLAHQVLDHGVLCHQLQPQLLILLHGLLALVNDLQMNITDMAHFVDYGLEVTSLSLELNVLLDYV